VKVLRVGDPHVRPSNIDESDKLFSFIAELALKEQVDRIELLGDLFHTHAVLRLEVMEFWDSWLPHLADICKTIVLVGNHDQSGDYTGETHALSVFHRINHKNLKIVDCVRLEGAIGYVSYIHDKQRFIELANGLVDSGAKTLVCHATFNGSTFENGFYAPDGIDPDSIKANTIISGHIHKEQEFGKVIYPGTARWDSGSDANQSKGIWIFEHAEDGSVTSRDFYSTADVCAPIYSFVWREGEEQPVIPEGSRASVEAIGSSVFTTKAKVALKGKASFRAKITDKAVRENRKASASVLDFLENIYKSSVDKEKLKTYLKEKQFV
jgi:DNA repair exonuclease SbcCD nuclease subunit